MSEVLVFKSAEERLFDEIIACLEEMAESEILEELVFEEAA